MRETTIIFCLSMAAVGAATGYSVGLSETSFVSTILPLLFSLIAGGSGFMLARMNLAARLTQQQSNVSMLGILVFASTYLTTMLHAFHLRLPEKPLTIEAVLPEGKSILDGFTLKQSIDLYHARNTLDESGATQSEQKTLLLAFLNRIQDHPWSSIEACHQLRNSTDAFAAVLTTSPDATHAQQEELENLNLLGQELKRLAITLHACPDTVSANQNLATATLVSSMQLQINEALQRSLFERSDFKSSKSPWLVLAAFENGQETLSRLMLQLANKDHLSPFHELTMLTEPSISALSADNESGATATESVAQ